MAGLYLHIPFCTQACHYCDFHFSTSRGNVDAMVDALCVEMALQKDYLGHEAIETVYFGGGTPSLLDEIHLQRLNDAIHRNFTVENPEITLEANPDDLTEKKLGIIKKAGINRLSIGIQSFDDDVLKMLNRIHTSLDAMACMAKAREIGFDNISIDLIYAIPGQRDELWRKNIEKAIEISPEHISAYALTIEEKTVFGQWQKKGKFLSAEEDVAAAQMETLMEITAQMEYEQYEISNFCKPGLHSKHNSGYWRQKKYLGIGPSAHSYDTDSRQHNVSSNARYIQSIGRSEIPCQKEVLSRENKINEYLFTRLRTSWGCDLKYLHAHFDFDLLAINEKKINTLASQGLVQVRDGLLLLTRRGKLFADKIASDLFAGD